MCDPALVAFNRNDLEGSLERRNEESLDEIEWSRVNI